jgi:hypothetical protein
MKIKLIIFGLILSLVISVHVTQIIPVCADDGGQQPEQKQPVLSDAFEEYI